MSFAPTAQGTTTHNHAYIYLINTQGDFEQTKGKRYDFFGAIGIVLPIKHSKSKYFCSEWCAEVIGFHCPNEFSPERLSRLLREFGYEKVV